MKVDYATTEAIGLKICSLEKEEIHAKDNDIRNGLGHEIKALWWVSSLLGIDSDVSNIRQHQTELNNKSWKAAQKSAIEELNETKKGDF
jgi:hypothetical protein